MPLACRGVEMTPLKLLIFACRSHRQVAECCDYGNTLPSLSMHMDGQQRNHDNRDALKKPVRRGCRFWRRPAPMDALPKDLHDIRPPKLQGATLKKDARGIISVGSLRQRVVITEVIPLPARRSGENQRQVNTVDHKKSNAPAWGVISNDTRRRPRPRHDPQRLPCGGASLRLMPRFPLAVVCCA